MPNEFNKRLEGGDHVLKDLIRNLRGDNSLAELMRMLKGRWGS